MRILRFSAKLLTILAVISPVLMAGGFENSGIGTKARGMAGAFRAVADDWTAAYYNPAGYAYIYDNQLGGSLGMVHLRDELTPDYRYGGEYETGIFNDRINYNNHQILSNPSGGFLARLPIWGETVVGLSGFQPFDYNNTWELYKLPAAYNDSLSLPGNQYSNNLDVTAIQLTFGREFIEDKLALGLGLQLLRADLLYSDIVFRNNPYPAPLNDRPYDRITEWAQMDGYGFGFGLNFGMLLNLSEKFSVGLTASVPFDITVDGTAKLEFYMPRNETLAFSTDSSVISNPGTAENLFVAGAKIVDTADFETELNLPPQFGLGLSYAIIEDLTVAFDASYTLWSQYEGMAFIYTEHRGLTGAADTNSLANAFFTTDLTSPADWDNTMSVALGLSYNLKDRFTFMVGGGYDQSPSEESAEFVPQLVDPGDKTTIAGGFIAHIDCWDLGISTSYTSAKDLTVTDLVDTDNDGQFDSFPGLYKAETYETVLSINYRF